MTPSVSSWSGWIGALRRADFRSVMPIREGDAPGHPARASDERRAVANRDHGFPLRAIAPGWVGSSQIKWLGRIVVSSEPQWTRNNTTSYVLIGDDYEPRVEAPGRVVTVQSIKSALALPWPARLSGSRTSVWRVFAHSPHGDIASVEWSEDQRFHLASGGD